MIPTKLRSVLCAKTKHQRDRKHVPALNVMTACWWYVRQSPGMRSSSSVLSYFLSILQGIWRIVGEHWHCTKLSKDWACLQLSWCNNSNSKWRVCTVYSEGDATAYINTHKHSLLLPYISPTYLQTETANKKTLVVLQADKHICIALTWNNVATV